MVNIIIFNLKYVTVYMISACAALSLKFVRLYLIPTGLRIVDLPTCLNIFVYTIVMLCCLMYKYVVFVSRRENCKKTTTSLQFQNHFKYLQKAH